VSPPPGEALTGQFIKVVSTDNATRQHINDTATQIATQMLATDRRVFAFPAKLPKSVTSTDMAKIQDLTDSQTGNVAVFLKLYIGELLTFSLHCRGFCGANPTATTLQACQPESKRISISRKGLRTARMVRSSTSIGTRTQRLHKKNDGVWVASRLPANVYVNLHYYQFRTRFPGLPGTRPASVIPILQSRSTFKLQKRTLSIKGFPLVPAVSTTVHGVQGNTRDQIVNTDLRPPHFRRVDRHALYVSLSRDRTRTGLYWMGRKPDDGDFEFFRPSQDVLMKDRRLQTLAAETAARLRM
jgi:hypothetical protein